MKKSNQGNSPGMIQYRLAHFNISSLLLIAVFAFPAAVAQDRVTYQVELTINGNVLDIVSPSNCGGERQPGEICVSEGHAADIEFSLGRGFEDWEISGMLIRDPADNWLAELPPPTAAEFGEFSSNGVFLGSLTGDGKLVITDRNRDSLAIQYKISARNRESGEQAAPAHSVIENSGGTPFGRD